MEFGLSGPLYQILTASVHILRSVPVKFVLLPALTCQVPPPTLSRTTSDGKSLNKLQVTDTEVANQGNAAILKAQGNSWQFQLKIWSMDKPNMVSEWICCAVGLILLGASWISWHRGWGTNRIVARCGGTQTTNERSWILFGTRILIAIASCANGKETISKL